MLVILKRLQLVNFRNYSKLDLEFDGQPTILIGNNAVGKSNLLESVYFLSTTKSARADLDAELIKEGEQFSRIEGVAQEQEQVNLEIVMSLGDGQDTQGHFGKRLRVNGLGKRAFDFVGTMPAVMFSPSDINMITGSPSLRRWHLDLALAQVDSQYKKALTLYESVLTNRNKILKRIKEGLGRVDELQFWTEELLRHGEVVSDARAAFFETINNFDKTLGSFNFNLKSSLLTAQRLAEYQNKEIAAAATLIGPHRDDFSITLENKNLAHFGSRGEQRLATLAFKLAQLEYMALSLGKRPVLLLDDVFSELDGKHRAYVVQIIPRQQTLMATVELENIPKRFLESARILTVDNGKVTR